MTIGCKTSLGITPQLLFVTTYNITEVILCIHCYTILIHVCKGSNYWEALQCVKTETLTLFDTLIALWLLRLSSPAISSRVSANFSVGEPTGTVLPYARTRVNLQRKGCEGARV